MTTSDNNTYLIISRYAIRIIPITRPVIRLSFIEGFFIFKNISSISDTIREDIIESTKINGDVKKLVKGLMIESYIEDGCQKAEEGVYGKSITDPCLGWEKTERLILDLADMR